MKSKRSKVRSAAKVLATGLVAMLLALPLGACIPNADEQTDTPAQSQTGSQGAQQTAGKSIEQTYELYGSTIKLTVEPLMVQDGLAALTVNYELVGELSPAFTSVGLQLGSITALGSIDGAPTNIGVIDVGAGIYYEQLHREGDFLSENASDFAKTDETQINGQSYLADGYPTTKSVSVFKAPASSTVDVYIGGFGLIEDLSVVEGDNTAAIAIAAPEGITPGYEDSFSSPLQAVQASYSDQMITKQESDTITLAIGSDVLFASGQSALSAEAMAAIESAAAQVKQAAPSGEIRVVGHTDAEGDEASNQTLSEARAASVAEALGPILGSGYTITTAGMGETQPVAVGTDPAAYAANRRVELVFSGEINYTSTTTVDGDAAGIPATTAPSGEGAGTWVTYSTYNGIDPTVLSDEAKTDYEQYAVMVESVQRTDLGLVGTLRLKAVKGYADGDPLLVSAFNTFDATRDIAKRGYDLMSSFTGGMGISLLTPQGRLYPYDYTKVATSDTDGTASIVGDTIIFYSATMPVDSGEEAIAKLTVIWPDTGQDIVDVEVPGAFRITGVDVS